ncbi:MAG: C40 family peptidase [Bacteroidota bacterium]
MIIIVQLVLFAACQTNESSVPDKGPVTDNTRIILDDTIQKLQQALPLVFPAGSVHINTDTTSPEVLLAFANTLTGTPYLYGSTDPANGFDCSGFITYVFNHFNIAVPRSSIGFTDIEREISLPEAKPGDIILFTGTEVDSTFRKVGHMGIISSNQNGECTFIHSTSGKAYGVTTSPLSKNYLQRFVKVLRVFPGNDSL